MFVFYTRKEVATRITILYTGNVLATAFAGLMAAGVFYGMDGLDESGRVVVAVCYPGQGTVTFAIAIAGFLLLPDLPLTTK